MERHGNLIDGEWRPARGGDLAEVSAADDRTRLLGAWPVSGLADVDAALEHLAAGARELARRPRAQRLEALRAAAAALRADPRGTDALHARIGLAPGEEPLAPFAPEPLLADLEEAPAGVRACGIAWVACHWSELEGGLFASLARALAGGAPVLLAADPRLPMVADRVARALLAGGLPPASLALLHGVRREAFRVGVADPRVDALWASDTDPAVVRRLRAACEARGLAGQHLTLLRADERRVGADDPLEDRAQRLVEEAFGLRATFSGQRAGQVARVRCDARVFSRFTDALLARLEASEAGRAPLWPLDPATWSRAREHVAASLDEGATPIAGADSLEGRGEGPLWPTVLTNVEPFMGCARRVHPLPVLCLVRAQGADGVRPPRIVTP